MVQQIEPATPCPPPTLWQLFLVFARIGLTSFGGGLSGWLLRDFVHNRRWLSEEEFLNGLAVSQALPGVNVTNMSIWIGYRLQGPPGALIGFLGIIMPSSVVILLLGVLFSTLTDLRPAQIALTGAAAAAIGLPLHLGVTAALRVRRQLLPLTILLATFVAVAVFRLPLIWVVLLAGTLGTSVELVRLRRARG